jgi:hypothetical protein
LPWCSIPKADRIAAALGATHASAPLYQFGLIHVRAIPTTTTCVGRGRRLRHRYQRTTPRSNRSAPLDRDHAA